jgi:hypothetical protein
MQNSRQNYIFEQNDGKHFPYLISYCIQFSFVIVFPNDLSFAAIFFEEATTVQSVK